MASVRPLSLSVSLSLSRSVCTQALVFSLGSGLRDTSSALHGDDGSGREGWRLNVFRRTGYNQNLFALQYLTIRMDSTPNDPLSALLTYIALHIRTALLSIGSTAVCVPCMFCSVM